MITIHLWGGGGGSWAFWGGSFYPSNILGRTLRVSTFYPLVIWSHMFWPSVMWNLCKAHHKWGKSIRTFDCCRPQLPNLWLLLVILIFFNSKPLPVTFCFIINGWFSRVGHWTCINAYFHKHIHDLLITLFLKTDNDGTKYFRSYIKMKKRKNWEIFAEFCLEFLHTFTFCRNTWRQGAKKVCFIACHSGNLQLACTNPRVISTSLKKNWWALITVLL